MLPDTFHDREDGTNPDAPVSGEQIACQQAIRQVEHRRRFWDYWIIYPAIVWVLATAAGAWRVFGRKPITEGEIKREIDRQAGQRH